MKRNELKKVLKPLIKECIKEVMFEDGTLSGIISEVVQGLNTKPITAAPQTKPVMVDRTQERRQVSEKMNEAKKTILDAIGKDAYNGVNLFEGTTPMRSAGTAAPTPSSPLANVEPGDSGIDISSIMGMATRRWKDLI